jgi:hypothetical protein
MERLDFALLSPPDQSTTLFAKQFQVLEAFVTKASKV